MNVLKTSWFLLFAALANCSYAGQLNEMTLITDDGQHASLRIETPVKGGMLNFDLGRTTPYNDKCVQETKGNGRTRHGISQVKEGFSFSVKSNPATSIELTYTELLGMDEFSPNVGSECKITAPITKSSFLRFNVAEDGEKHEYPFSFSTSTNKPVKGKIIIVPIHSTENSIHFMKGDLK